MYMYINFPRILPLILRSDSDFNDDGSWCVYGRRCLAYMYFYLCIIIIIGRQYKDTASN